MAESVESRQKVRDRMTPKPKRLRKHLQISAEEARKLLIKKESSFFSKILSVSELKATPRMEIKPNMAGSTDSSQRMIDFTEARRIGLPAGEVDRYRSHQ